MGIACLFKCFLFMWAVQRNPGSLVATNFESLNYKTEKYKNGSWITDEMQKDATLREHYPQLPVFLYSRLPLVEKELFSPTHGAGDKRLPGKVRKVLFPAVPTGNPLTTAIRFKGVVIMCNGHKVRVQVHKEILGVVGSSFQLHFGTCKPSKSTKKFVYFEYDMGQCGSKRTLIHNRMAYTNTLSYDPPERSGPIRRASAFTLPIVCHYNRYQYSYTIGYRPYMPKAQMPKLYKPMSSKVQFILTPKNAQWERLLPEHQFEIGKPMYFEAEALSTSPDERLYVHSCHVTPSNSYHSALVFPVVENFGCMVEGKNGHSRFIPYKQNVVRFTADAFLLKAMSGQQLYMHCTMSVGGPAPSTTAKSCNYDTKAGRWQELYGSASVCSCCDSTCISTAPSGEIRLQHLWGKMISTIPWTIKYMVETTTALKKNAGKTPVPKATAKMIKMPPTSQSEEKLATTMDEVGRDLEWPFGGRGVHWVEVGGVKGSAVVEEDSIAPRRKSLWI